MSLEKNKENKEHKESNEEINIENKIESNDEHDEENRYVKNSVDYSSCESSQICDDEENDVQDLDQLYGNDLDEFELLSLFDVFDLIDIGIHDFIREVYFED